jgi:hypothetical protein
MLFTSPPLNRLWAKTKKFSRDKKARKKIFQKGTKLRLFIRRKRRRECGNGKVFSSLKKARFSLKLLVR